MTEQRFNSYLLKGRLEMVGWKFFLGLAEGAGFVCGMILMGWTWWMRTGGH